MRIGQVLAVIGVVVSLAGAHLQAQGRAGAKRFTLSGAVVNANNQPMAGVEITLETRVKVVGDPVVSDAAGRFAFNGLPEGEYMLTAQGSAFGTINYGETPDPFKISSIRLSAEYGDKWVVFRILPRGVIDGTIRDEFGDPMLRINVSVVRPVWRDGRITMANVSEKSTDDRGRYRFGNLAPGSYTVCVGGRNAPAPMTGPVDYTTRVDNRAYARTCNRAIQLAPGQHALVDLTPLVGTTVTLSGHVRNLPAQTGFSVSLVSDDNTAPQVNAFVNADQGTFSIRGVAPGRYRLGAHTYSNVGTIKSMAAEIPLETGGADINGLELDLAAQATVDVTFRGLAEDEFNKVSAMLRAVQPTGQALGYSQAKAGEFHFPGTPEGRYWLVLNAPPDRCVESVKLGNREVRGMAFDVASGAALHFDVAVSQSCGAIHVRAVREDTAVPGAVIVLLRSGTPSVPGELSEVAADDEGEYTFPSLPSGRYLIWGWAEQGRGAMAGPASLSAVEHQATAVDVTPGDPVKVDVPLLTAEGQGQ